MDAFAHDVRTALRSLKKARGFTAVAVLVFTLGIGINTALFSIVNALFFRPLPVERPEDLVYLYEYSGDGRPMSALLETKDRVLDTLGGRADIFASMTGHTAFSTQISVSGAAERVAGELVLANYFEVLGVRPGLGRSFLPSDDAPADTRVLVISHRYWTTRFDADPEVIGRTVRVCCRRVLPSGIELEDTFTIVGVAPRGFKGATDPWSPSDFWMTFAHGTEYRQFPIAPIARLAPGVTLRAAQEWTRITGAHLIDERRQRARTLAQQASLDGRRFDALPATQVRTPLNPSATLVPAPLAIALTIVVIAVLLIGTANVTGLLMARGVARSGDVAVRRVLGAGLGRITRELMVEASALTLVGGVLGVLLASWMLGLLRAYTPDRFAIDTPIDSRVAAFTVAVCIAAGIITSIAPALQASRVNLLSTLPGMPSGGTRRIRRWMRHVVVVPQIALSLALLVAAGLQIRALLTLERADLGYETGDRIVLSIRLRPDPADINAGDALAERRAQRAQAFHRNVRAQLTGIREIGGAAMTSTLPTWVSADTSYTATLADGPGAVGVPAQRTFVDAGYFRTMGMHLRRGRDFDDRDVRSAPPVTMLNETLARRLSPDGNVVGRTLELMNDYPSASDQPQRYEVIGIVNDVDPILLDRTQAPVAYLAMAQQWHPPTNLVVAHVPGESPAAIDELKLAVTGADLFADVFRVQTMSQVVSDVLYPRRMATAILSVSALIGLLLATVGLYGVISYSIGQRRHELGVRAALGASRGDLVGLVLRDGGRVLVGGTLLGTILSYAAMQAARGRIAHIPPFDLLTVLVVLVLLAGIVIAACLIPAKRAARVDPLDSLRTL